MKYFAVILCLSGISLARKLPSYIEVCRPKHTDVNECIKRNIDILRPRFKDGIPELKIPSFQPYVLPFASASLGDNFNAILNNVKIYVMEGFFIDDLKADLDNFELYLKLRLPQVKTITDYSVKGKLMILNLDGAGVGHINITDVEAEVTGKGKKEKRNGLDYIVMTDIDIKPHIKNISVLLENLFPKNQELTDSANKLFNENQDVLIEDFSPIVLRVVKKLVSNLMNNFFSRYSYDVLFPDD